VNGGCWTNLKEVREYTEEKIKNSGMTLNNDQYAYTFVVDVQGGRISNTCTGQVTVGLYAGMEIKTGIRVLITIKEIGVRGNDTTLNNKVVDMVGEFFKK
jgi:hypothetical protein